MPLPKYHKIYLLLREQLQEGHFSNGLPGENAHAPDEWISVDNLRRGMRAMAMLYDEVAR